MINCPTAEVSEAKYLESASTAPVIIVFASCPNSVVAKYFCQPTVAVTLNRPTYAQLD